MNEPLPIAVLRQPAAPGGLAALYRLTDRLYRAVARNDIFDAALDAIAETLGCRRASILLFDAEGVMDFVAWRGLSDAYRTAVRGHTPWTRGTRDPEPIFVPDIAATAEPDAIKAAVRAENIRALAFIPLTVNGALTGKFMTYDEAPRAFSAHERELAVMIARQVGFALEREQAEDQRRLADAALRESEERFRLMSEHAPVMIWMSDEQGGCLHLNRMLREFWGVEDDDLANFDWRTTMHPEDVDRIGSEIWGAMLARRAVEIVGRYTNTSGEYRVLQTNARPRFSPSGEFLGMIGVNVDVTERERAEEALRHSAEQLGLATEAAEVGFWDVDNIGNSLYWPPRVKAMFGISPDVPVSMSDFYAGLHPDDREQVSAAYAAACDPERRDLYDVEYRTVGKEDNIVRWVAAKGRAMFDDQGRCVRVIGTAIDITERKHHEQLLRDSEAALRDLNHTLEERVAERTAERDRLWKNSQDIQIVLDRDGVMLAVSPAATRILGWTPGQLVGRPFLQFVLDPDVEGSRGAFVRARDGVLPSLPNRCKHADGSYRWIAWVAAPEGDLIYASGRDVTEERAKEKALAKAEEALRQAQKMEAIGQLTGGIAHDFNNLLQGLVASLELIRRKAGDPNAVRRFAEAGLKATERGSKLTGQLLAFSRAQKLELKPVDVGALIRSMRELMERTLGPAVRVSLDIEDGPLNALGDDVQLEMAILNLAINARDAMPDGGSLSIAARRRQLKSDLELPDGPYLEIAVADTGEGMPPDVLARAFDPFFTTKGVGKGTGLGLSQVYGMARQAGGAVRIDSRIGEGTTVRMLLRQSEAAARLPADAGADAEAVRSAARVMVVDDDADVRGFLGETLRALGYDACEAADGDAALAALERLNPDAIILDFAMPGRNGAEVAREMRRLRPGLPIIFASGFSETAAIDAIEGSPRLLRKPFRAEDLRAALAEVLDGSKPSARGPAAPPIGHSGAAQFGPEPGIQIQALNS